MDSLMDCLRFSVWEMVMFFPPPYLDWLWSIFSHLSIGCKGVLLLKVKQVRKATTCPPKSVMCAVKHFMIRLLHEVWG